MLAKYGAPVVRLPNGQIKCLDCPKQAVDGCFRCLNCGGGHECVTCKRRLSDLRYLVEGVCADCRSPQKLVLTEEQGEWCSWFEQMIRLKLFIKHMFYT